MYTLVRLRILAAILASAAPVGAFAQTSLTVEGTEFVLTIGDGRTFRSAQLAGATLMLGTGESQTGVTIKSVNEDAQAVGGRVFLHRFVVKDETGNPADLCAPDAEGRSAGFPVPNGNGGFAIVCTSGAIGKCIRWGYRPWEEKPGGRPLQALHQACVYMARADYGGDGSTNTRDGTLVEICDRFGVRPCRDDAPMAFEAAWGLDGAVCVARPRIPEIVSLADLAVRYPQLAPRLGPAVCSEAIALGDPAALVFNRSGEQP